MNLSLSPFTPESLVSRDMSGSPVPRKPAHSPYSGSILCLLKGFLLISAAAFIHSFKPPDIIRSLPSLSGHATACRWRSLTRVRQHRVSSPQGSSCNGCYCLCIAMDRSMCAFVDDISPLFRTFLHFPGIPRSV